ncbi:MAG: YfhO family protein [Candidatus Gottesmanbacteria bacterium]|nr:YfhO family protein [Candidatus Gottesmanbacteria bacterium]
MRSFFRRVWPYGVPIAFYALAVAVVFGRALIPGATEMIWGDDIHRAYYFYRQFFNNFLAQGVWPWWNPYNFAGTPFIAHPIVNMLYPPNWLFVLLPLNIAYSWHIALHLLWAMTGMYTLLRRELSNNPIIKLSNEKSNFSILCPMSYVLHPIGPWIAGLVFGLSGFFAARIWAGHVDVIAAASWMPWVVCAFGAISKLKTKNSKLEEYTQKYQERRRIVIAAVVLAMQLFAGYQTMAMLTLEAVGIMAAITFISQRASMKRIVIVIASIALSVLLAIGLFAVVLLPQQEFFRQTIRTYALPYSWIAYGSFEWRSLGQFFNPFFFGDQLTYSGPPPNFAEHAFFVGRVGLLVVLAVLLFRLPRVLKIPKSPMILAFGCIAFFGLWVSMGPNAPIDLQYILWKLVPTYKFLRIPPRHLILVAFGLSGLIGMSIHAIRSQHIVRIAGVLIAAEMIFYSHHFITLKPVPETRHDVDLIKILKQNRDPYRVLTNFGAWAPPRDSFDFDAGMQYGVFNATGYDTMILKPYYAFIDASNGKTTPSILDHDVQIPYLNIFSKATDFLNIKYILHPRAYDPLFGTKDPRFRLIREDVARDYRLYENTTVFPRFYFADHKEGKVNIVKYSPNEIILSTQSTTGATLMSSEVYYPGWEGFIDEQKVEIIKANNAFRALFVPAGNHTVIYRYNPRIFVIGGVISFITAGIMVFLWKKSYDIRTSL